MMWSLRNQFPLHFIVFKQTASHIPHEANIEQALSRSGYLSDPNQDPVNLGLGTLSLTRIGINRKVYQPSEAAILDRYYAKYRGAEPQVPAALEGAASCSSDPA